MGPRTEDKEKAPRSTYTISLSLKHSEKSLMLARLTHRSMEKNTQQKDILVSLIEFVITIKENPVKPQPLNGADLNISEPTP